VLRGQSSEPIDIFGEWCDEIAAANEQPEAVEVDDAGAVQEDAHSDQ
jgi:hypothetical protein